LAFLSILSCAQCIGENQFAYATQKGARDAIAYLLLAWLAAFREK
jgi:hypothetical protein